MTGSRARSSIKEAEEERARVIGISRAEGDKALSRLLRSCLPLSFLPALGESLYNAKNKKNKNFFKNPLLIQLDIMSYYEFNKSVCEKTDK